MAKGKMPSFMKDDDGDFQKSPMKKETAKGMPKGMGKPMAKKAMPFGKKGAFGKKGGK